GSFQRAQKVPTYAELDGDLAQGQVASVDRAEERAPTVRGEAVQPGDGVACHAAVRSPLTMRAAPLRRRSVTPAARGQRSAGRLVRLAIEQVPEGPCRRSLSL